MLERELERDAPSKRCADDGCGPEASVIHVAIDEPGEVSDAIPSAWFLGPTESRQVRCVNAVAGRRELEIEAPFHVSRGTETMDEQQWCSATAVHVMDAQRSQLDHLGVEPLGRAVEQ
jgi:hypothetical protein